MRAMNRSAVGWQGGKLDLTTLAPVAGTRVYAIGGVLGRLDVLRQLEDRVAG